MHLLAKISFLSLLFILLSVLPTIGQNRLIPNKYDSTYTKEIHQHREQYKMDFLKHEDSPLENHDLVHLQFFSPNPDYRVQAKVSETPDAKPFDLMTYSGLAKSYRQYGWLDFMIGTDSVRLAIYQSIRLQKVPGYKNYLFLPFKDATSGDATYGGGRYLNLSSNDIKEGYLTVDFNKAYNPYCAFSSGYNCPIPPAVNHLSIPILAGERNYTGDQNARKE